MSSIVAVMTGKNTTDSVRVNDYSNGNYAFSP
jgi:hypothetical protein